MTFPASVTTVTVTGRWRYADGSTAIPTGYVTFTPNAVLQVPVDGDVLPVRQVRATLDAQGQVSVTLMSTADADVAPSGWAYTVNEFVGGQDRTYLATFPAVAPGQTYDLSAVAPAASTPTYAYVLLASVGAPSGVASLDVTGNVPLAQLGNAPSGGGTPSGTVVTETAFGQSATAGAATPYSRGDHTHGTPAAPTVPGPSGTVTTETAFGQASNAGGGSSYSKGDHTHGTPAAPTAASVGAQPLDTGLTSFAALTGAGFVVATATDAMVMRTLVAGSAAVVVANGTGAAGNPSVDLNTLLKAVGALAGNGLVAQTAAGTVANRTLTAGSAAAVVTNGDGVSGNPTVDLNALLKAVGALAGNGIVAQTAAGTVANRTIVAGASSVNVTVTNGDGVAGNPSIDLTYGAWTSLTLLGPSNTAQGTPPLQFRNAPGGRVELRGQFSWTGAYTSGTAIATFPAGSLPYAAVQTGIRWSGTGSANSLINIDTSGNFSVASSTPSSGSILSMDGFSFIHA